MGEKGAVVIHVGDGLASCVRRHLAALGDDEPENVTIFRLPAHVRGCNERLYKPQMVSIGPYHHGNPAFRAMHKYKWQCLRDLLARCIEGCSCIEDCISMLRTLEPRARQCYFEPVELDGDEFVQMLLLDGCFVIEFLMKWLLNEKEDAVRNTAWSLPLIRCDLLLLDNQIPFFVIESLFALLSARLPTLAFDLCGVSSLMELLVMYMTRGQRKELPAGAEPSKKIRHLLHVHHLCSVPAQNPNSSTAESSGIAKWLKPKRAVGSLLPRFCISKRGKKRAPRTIPCATELQEAGVTFTKKKDKKNKKEADSSGSSFLDISFRNGVLEIPFLSVEDTTRSRFANLVAFEQCTMGPTEGRYMTSYACFMDCVINTAKDVAILHDCGIIENKLASDEELAVFFNQLCDGTSMDYEKHYLAPLFKEVREYCNLKKHRWRAKLVKDYFSSPWAIFSLAAAIAILIFTFLQTFFTIFPYYHPR